MSEHEVLDIAISVLNEVELWDSLDSTKEDNNRRIMILGYVDGVRTMTNEILKAMQTDDKDTNILNKPQTERSEPQTYGYMTAEQAEDYRKMLDKAEHKVYGNIEDEPQTEDLQDWKDRMWAEAVIASQTERSE